MKKCLISLFALLCFCAQALAETDSRGDTLMMVNKFSKNWEWGAGVGAQAFLAEYTITDFKVKDWWSPALDLWIQKWASPVFGIGIGFNAAGYKGLYYRDESGEGGDIRATFRSGSDSHYGGRAWMARGAYGNVFAKANFNLTNLFWGYDPGRIFDWTGYLGGGVIFPMSKVSYRAVGATFNAGLNFHWRLNRAWLLGFSVRGALVSDSFNGIDYVVSGDNKNIPLDGMIGATVGFAYRFGFVSRKDNESGKVSTHEWVPESVAVTSSAVTAREIERAVREASDSRDSELAAASRRLAENDRTIAALQDRNAALADELRNLSGRYWAHVNFVIDRWEISTSEKVNILAASDYIKSHPGQKFIVCGYADVQTADAAHNEMLSRKRAEAVYNVLVGEFGVNPEQISAEHYGGVDYMFFQDAQCSRSVIITAAKGE